MNDQELTARAREAAAVLRRRPGDLDRLAAALLAELADRPGAGRREHDVNDETALLYDVQSNLNTLASALARWEIRDETRADPRARLAANAAMDAIDAMLRELHAMRSRLVSEMRVSDDAAAHRADELLGRSRQADDDRPPSV